RQARGAPRPEGRGGTSGRRRLVRRRGGGRMSTFGVVVNPTSGLGRGRSVGEQTVAALRERGHEVVDLSRDSADEARAAARRAVAQGLDALVVVGGDGIVNLGVNVVAETDVPLGIVAAGTGNDVARS